jgi:hypothetical protein
MSTPPQSEFRSEQYEFTDEHNRTINDLANAMGVVATLMKVLGLVFLIFGGLLTWHSIQVGTGYAAPVGMGAAALLCLAIGFWTSGSAHSFRRIVESKNRDVWHLMNALESLRNMYSLLRTIILGTLVLLAVGLILFGVDRFSRS